MASPRPPSDLAKLSRPELEALAEGLLAAVADLRQTVAALRDEIAHLRRDCPSQTRLPISDEIAHLKGLKGRPSLTPSGMEQATESKSTLLTGTAPRRKGGKTARLTIHEDRVIPASVPAGSRFKGYQSFVVQDLILRAHVIRFRRERWVTPDGVTVVAPLPPEVRGHFGAQLKRYLLVQYHQGQVTIPRLLTQLHDLGLQVSKRQLVRLLNSDKEAFLIEKSALLEAGLTTARWITVDDTGARHRGQNVVTTHIGNDRFAWFATTASKSRRNFLELLRAGHQDYVVNDAALAYMRRHKLPQRRIDQLAVHPTQRFADDAAWRAHRRRSA